MWAKTCVQTQNNLTDWQPTHEAQDCSKTKVVFILLLYWCYSNIFTVPGQWKKIIPHTYIHYIWKITQSSYGYTLATSFAKAQTSKLSGLHLFFSPDLSLLSPTFLQRPSPLPVRRSLLLKLPSKASETALPCDTNFPTKVAHWLQLKHTKIWTLW